MIAIWNLSFSESLEQIDKSLSKLEIFKSDCEIFCCSNKLLVSAMLWQHSANSDCYHSFLLRMFVVSLANSRQLNFMSWVGNGLSGIYSWWLSSENFVNGKISSTWIELSWTFFSNTVLKCNEFLRTFEEYWLAWNVTIEISWILTQHSLISSEIQKKPSMNLEFLPSCLPGKEFNFPETQLFRYQLTYQRSFIKVFALLATWMKFKLW